ncbi:MAG: gluconokinase, partial [Longimicrobiaceae bacterium]
MRVTITVMGVSGAGKSFIGERLAEALSWTFLEADDFHSAANGAKMSGGIPLRDEDRWPWLSAIRTRLTQLNAEGTGAVLACSALKAEYREVLRDGPGELRVVYLNTPRHVLEERLEERPGHFFDPTLLQSQLDTLEPPE